MKKVLFIGLGHMGGALISGIGKKQIPDIELYGYNREVTKAKALAKQVPQLHLLKKLDELTAIDIDIIVIGVRPVDFVELCTTLNQYNLKNKTIISMVNAISIKVMEQQFCNQENLTLMRIMPNMNASIQESVTAIAAKNANERQMNFVKSMFASCGTVIEISEAKFATFAAIAGCMPAYVFTFYKAAVEYAQNHGFSEVQAMKIIGETIIGSIRNAQTSKDSLTKMIEQICVPNGSTIEGQKVLESNHFEEIIQEVLKAANDKA